MARYQGENKKQWILFLYLHGCFFCCRRDKIACLENVRPIDSVRMTLLEFRSFIGIHQIHSILEQMPPLESTHSDDDVLQLLVLGRPCIDGTCRRLSFLFIFLVCCSLLGTKKLE
jgi:hypothetical protein